MEQEAEWKELERDLGYYASYLQGIAHEVLDSGTSKYPVFIAYEDQHFGSGLRLVGHKRGAYGFGPMPEHASGPFGERHEP